MSVNTTIANIKEKMTEFKDELVRVLDQVTGRAPHADTADTLGGQTPAQVITTLRAEVTKHTSKKAVGIHKVNLEQLGTYTGPQFDLKFDMLLDNNSGVPFSFYGDREYLPPGITGSFESGSSASPYGNMAMILEDNGTLVVLRSGTDGDSAGLYYSYLRNAMNEPDVTGQLVVTNTKYQPAYFPGDRQGYCVLSSTQQCIMGKLANKSDGKFNGYYLSLTNNTFDQTKHTGVVIPEDGFIQTQIEGTATQNIPIAFVKGAWVYILIQNLSGFTPEVGFKVFRMPLANLISGNYVAPEQLTNWTINRGSAGTVSKTDMTLFDNINDMFTWTGQPAGFRQGMSNGNGAMTVNITDDGRVLMTYLPYLQLYGYDFATPEQGLFTCLHYEINLDAKSVNASTYHNSKPRVDYNGARFMYYPGPSFPVARSAAEIGATGFYDTYFGNLGGQSNNCLYMTKFNQMWTFSTTTYLTQRTVHRFTFFDGTTFSQMAAASKLPAANGGWNITGRFGSPLSQSFTCHGNVGDYQVMCINANILRNVFGNYAVRATLEGDGSYQYKSISGTYAFKGFNPTVNRAYAVDLGGDNTSPNVALNEGDPATGNVVSCARFTTAYPVTRAARINENLVKSGSVSCAAGVLANVRQQVINDLANRGYALYSGSANSPIEVEIVVPQLYGDMPPFVVASFIRNNRDPWQAVYALNISGSRQNVTGASIISASFAAAVLPVGLGSGLYITNTDNVGQTAIRRVAGGFAIGMCASSVYALFGDNEPAMMAVNYSTSNGTFSIVGEPLWNYYAAAPAGWLNFPNRGMFMSQVSEFLRGSMDGGTKMLGTLAVTDQGFTKGANAMLDNFTDGSKTLVMISQKIVSAWTIYFSDVTPVMLDGLYQQMPPLTYNLTPGTDANKTFYLWIVRTGNTFAYKVVANSTATPAGDSALYLGYAVTTPEGIQQIVAEKRVAVGGMVLARNSQGSAIPLTSGTPNNPGKLNWK